MRALSKLARVAFAFVMMNYAAVDRGWSWNA
jgi:hypothetical protein